MEELINVGVEIETCFHGPSPEVDSFSETSDVSIRCDRRDASKIEFVSSVARLSDLLDPSSPLRRDIQRIVASSEKCSKLKSSRTLPGFPGTVCHTHVHMSMDGCTKHELPGFWKTLHRRWVESQDEAIRTFQLHPTKRFSRPNEPNDYVRNKNRLLNISPSSDDRYKTSSTWPLWHVEWRGFPDIHTRPLGLFFDYVNAMARIFYDSYTECARPGCEECSLSRIEASHIDDAPIFSRFPRLRDNADMLGRSVVWMRVKHYRRVVIVVLVFVLVVARVAMCLLRSRRRA